MRNAVVVEDRLCCIECGKRRVAGPCDEVGEPVIATRVMSGDDCSECWESLVPSGRPPLRAAVHLHEPYNPVATLRLSAAHFGAQAARDAARGHIAKAEISARYSASLARAADDIERMLASGEAARDIVANASVVAENAGWRHEKSVISWSRTENANMVAFHARLAVLLRRVACEMKLLEMTLCC